MRTIHTLQEAGADKTLRLSIPVDEPNRRYQVTVVLEPEHAVMDQPTNDGSGWPPGFIEQTAGSIPDESFVRHAQGELEKRGELDS